MRSQKLPKDTFRQKLPLCLLSNGFVSDFAEKKVFFSFLATPHSLWTWSLWFICVPAFKRSTWKSYLFPKNTGACTLKEQHKMKSSRNSGLWTNWKWPSYRPNSIWSKQSLMCSFCAILYVWTLILLVCWINAFILIIKCHSQRQSSKPWSAILCPFWSQLINY